MKRSIKMSYYPIVSSEDITAPQLQVIQEECEINIDAEKDEISFLINSQTELVTLKISQLKSLLSDK